MFVVCYGWFGYLIVLLVLLLWFFIVIEVMCFVLNLLCLVVCLLWRYLMLMFSDCGFGSCFLLGGCAGVFLFDSMFGVCGLI